MESTVLILIGAALFCQAWHILGMYTDGRPMGAIMGLLGVMALATVAFDGSFIPSVLTTDGAGAALITPLAVTATNNLLNAIVVVWGVYALGVAAHAIWDLDDRAVGFYAAVVAGVSLIATIYFAVELRDRYGELVWVTLSGSTLILTLLSGLAFFYLAPPFRVLRLLTGWSMLIGGAVVVLIGALLASEVIIVKL